MQFVYGLMWFLLYFTVFALTLYGILCLVQYAIFKKARIKQPISKRTRIICSLLGVAVLCGAYELLSYRQHQKNPDDTTIPSISQLAEGFRMMTEPETRENDLRAAFNMEQKEDSAFDRISKTWLYQDFTATYGRLIKGLLWGCLISIVIGILMGCYEWFEALLLPPFNLLSYIPGTAMFAVFFALVSTGEPMFVAMIGFGILPTLTKAIYLSAKHDLHEEEINKAYTLGATNFEVTWSIVTQQILPKVIDNIRLQIGPAMVFLIAAEMLVGQEGFGYRIRLQQRLINMNVVYDYLLILGILGLLMDRGMIWVRMKLCPWFDRSK